jgi:hypothetical protein
MSQIFRLASLTLLCLALVVGSMSMAVARGQSVAAAQAGSTIEICSGYGVTTITLDAQGNPVGPVHLCPDCLAGLAAYLPPNLPPLAAWASTTRRATLAGDHVAVRAAGVLVTRARGPPLLG